MNLEIIERVSKMAKQALSMAIERKRQSVVARSAGRYDHADMLDMFMRDWARDFAITVKEWNLDPRTGGVKK